MSERKKVITTADIGLVATKIKASDINLIEIIDPIC